MNTKKLLHELTLALGRLMPGLIFLLLTRPAAANPTGLTVKSGSASSSVSGSKLTVTAGNNAVLGWQSFNIASGETTAFVQPSASSVVWNQIGGQSASQIYGTLQANGVVVLLNSSGFYFGPNSYVSAAGLVVSTANCTPPENSGGAWEFNGPPALASIVNYGQIQIGEKGCCYLIANQVENHGSIEVPDGSIGLAAGKTVLLSERADGRGMSLSVTLPAGSVDNYGTLVADGGSISLNAKVVNQNGLIQADSVQNVNGVIELVAGGQLNLGADSQILARGDDSAGGSAGGSITLKSDNSFSDAAGGKISMAGGANGGDGGTVEISAPAMAAIHSTIDGTAQNGSTGGTLLLDRDNITLNTSGSGSDSDMLYLNVNSDFTGLSKITLEANNQITVDSYTTWDLSGSTGQTQGALVLAAGGDIVFNTGSAIYDNNKWTISLYAGVSDFNKLTVQSGNGSISMGSDEGDNPTYIQTSSGAINLEAGANITLGLGYVNTTGGGSITAHALAGSIDTGGIVEGYYFQSANTASAGCTVGSYVGGISTLAGGDVTLIAGGNITSVLPVSGGYYYDGTLYLTQGSVVGTAGSGAYGNQSGEKGNVTLIAGGDVTGHYLVANGQGKIYAGVEMDANGNPVTANGNYMLGDSGSAGTDSKKDALALSVLGQITSGWEVTAAQDIYLQEVRNPNGVYNTYAGGADHEFDYAAGDYVNLTAGNLVEIGSTLLPRDTSDGLYVPMIFPSILNISAGAGGVILTGNSTYNKLILYPSAAGSLIIDTTDGGSLVSSLPNSYGSPQLFSLIVSGSSAAQYLSSSTFGIADFAATPIHLNSSTAIDLNISGDMDLVYLAVPEAATINVVGDMNNCRFQGLNLSASDVTSITVGEQAKINMENAGLLNAATDSSLTVGGNLTDRSAFTTITLDATASTPDLSSLAEAYGNTVNGTAISSTTLAASFYYNATTKKFTYQNIAGVSLADLLNLLENLTVDTGQVDLNGNAITKTVQVIDAATASALLAEYNTEGAIPVASGGITLGGGGKLKITAANLDLGTTTGIVSEGVGLYEINGAYPLASLFTKGADIDLNLTGGLIMYSSAIASLNGGAISITTGGSVSVGSADFAVKAQGARGIYTTDDGDVTVIAGGDINVNGSRIAAYDGGDVTVESLNGDINAGSGGSGYVTISSYFVDPTTRAVTYSAPTIPGSGILATTFPSDKTAVVGNILVETPNGSINASSGGIVQLPLNKAADNAKAIIEVLAGYELRDSSGNRVTAADIASGTAVEVSASRNIDASGSGIIGENVVGEATGLFTGVVFGKGNVNLTSPQFSGLTVLGKTVEASGDFGTGVTIIGSESVQTSGSGEATILSQNANGSGSSFAQGTGANATSAAASASAAAVATAAAKTETGGDADDLNKKKKPISLARKVSRVTVLLPGQH